MPRQARLDAPGTLHHVMIRGIEGSGLFRDDKDRSEFLSRVSELVGITKTRILAWTLMDNHIHLVLLSGAPVDKGDVVHYNHNYFEALQERGVVITWGYAKTGEAGCSRDTPSRNDSWN
jgi:REP element-mobilizing transposase RayT